MENFSDKVNKAFGDGWNSNPQFSKALKEIEQVVEESRIEKEQSRIISAQGIVKDDSSRVAQVTKEDDDAR